MKKIACIKRFLAGLLTCSMLIPAVGCGQNSNKLDIPMDLSERQRYDNMFDSTRTQNWHKEGGAEFGVGDPFVLRYDGEYYLFCSSPGGNYGYKVWKSKDLVNYTFLGDFDLKTKDGKTGQYNAIFAPEVFYWNGDFYMVGSPSGTGHYIFKSETGLPYGDYVVTGDRLDDGKFDGSVFIDDDGKMYLLEAHWGSISVYDMNSPTSIDPDSERALHAPSDGWAEGPFIIKRNGTYYLTFAANNVETSNYRIQYTYSDNGVVGLYSAPANNPILLNAIGEQVALGHSSSVIGPDLDSSYIAYHNLVFGDDAYYRQYNINRLSFSGNRMNVLGPAAKGIQVPNQPDFYTKDGKGYTDKSTDKLTEKNGKLLSDKSTEDVFTAEFNLADMSGGQKCLFGVNGNDEYSVSFKDSAIILSKGDKVLAQTEFTNGEKADCHVTITVASANGRTTVQFNGMTKIDYKGDKVKGGQIGYEGVDSKDVGATIFSNNAFGSSDGDEAKLTEGDFFATDYNVKASSLSDKSGVKFIELDDNDDFESYSNTETVSLGKKGDYVSYKLDVLKDGYYDISGLVSNESAGAVVDVYVDGELNGEFTVPTFSTKENVVDYGKNSAYALQTLHSLSLKKGIHYLTLRLNKGSYSAVYYEIREGAKDAPVFENDLSSIVPKGVIYNSNWNISDNAHYTLESMRYSAMFGTQKLRDYTASVDVKFSDRALRTGLVMRMNNPSNRPNSGENSMQGYFISLTTSQITLQKLNNSAVIIDSVRKELTPDVYHTIKAKFEGCTLTVWVDGEKTFTYTDAYAFTHGGIGLYSDNTESYFKNLKVSANY